MSIWKPKNSAFYRYDFWLGGHRFHGTTECTTRKEAKAVEALRREDATKYVKAMKRSRTSLLIDDVAARLWTDRAQYDAEPDATSTNLDRLVTYFGKTTPLTDIDHTKAKQLVAWRRGHRVTRRSKLTKEEKDALPLITNSTVNRSTIAVLRRLFFIRKGRRCPVRE